MNQSKRIRSGVALLAALSLAWGTISTAAKRQAQPNIIFIVTDDHGYNDLEATDLRGEVNMPNVNRLSSGGALMTQAYCTAPQCVPSRAGIVRRRYQQYFGIDSNREGHAHLGTGKTMSIEVERAIAPLARGAVS